MILEVAELPLFKLKLTHNLEKARSSNTEKCRNPLKSVLFRSSGESSECKLACQSHIGPIYQSARSISYKLPTKLLAFERSFANWAIEWGRPQFFCHD
jgi:hypothetical protein